jgi:hypothetical protein
LIFYSPFAFNAVHIHRLCLVETSTFKDESRSPPRS